MRYRLSKVLIDGDETLDEVGRSIASAGDVNGDSYSDLLVGNAKGARVYHGSPDGLSATHAWSFDCGDDSAFCGDAVSSAGDVNGDGFSDVVIGALGFDSNGQASGAVFVFHGGEDGLDSEPALQLNGPSAFQRFGTSLCSGDVNGDGFSDIVVGTPGDLFGDNIAKVFLYFGSSSGLSSVPDWEAQGLSSEWFGQSVACADVSGDGITDIIVGAYEAGTELVNESGEVFVYYGNGSKGNPIAAVQGDEFGGAVEPGLLSTDSGFSVGVFRKFPVGASAGRLFIEVKPLGVPFDGTDLFQGSSGNPNGLQIQLLRNLEPETPYHWRARFQTIPYMNYTRWFSTGGNGAEEMDFRTENGDLDGDGIRNQEDNCAFVANPDQLNSDDDALGDACETCSFDPNKFEPGLCGCGQSDDDSDDDGTPDCGDPCDEDPNKIGSGQCGCGVPDTDSDGDGRADCIDGCPADLDKVSPGQCGCGSADTDSDSDGTADCVDECPVDRFKSSPGECGCGVMDFDSDQDGVPNCKDGCPGFSLKTEPGVCGCLMRDIDTDGDGTLDCVDSCPLDAERTEPGRCGCNPNDSDSDGLLDCDDGCPLNSLKSSPGVCGCDIEDINSDGDSFLDCQDLCPFDFGTRSDGCPEGLGPSAPPVDPEIGDKPLTAKEEVILIATELPVSISTKTKKRFLKSTGRLIKLLKRRGGELALRKGTTKGFQKKLLKLKRKLRRAKGAKVSSFSKKIARLIGRLQSALV